MKSLHEHEQPLIFAGYAPVLLQFYYVVPIGAALRFFHAMREIILQFPVL
ncbi:hypothetical protein SZ54_2931 [Rhizobium sp. UR51a]|nr:hypothetical protein SZ54_2931 [Rhizobium sp. UR51a]